jgi:hypothetical protein
MLKTLSLSLVVFALVGCSAAPASPAVAPIMTVQVATAVPTMTSPPMILTVATPIAIAVPSTATVSPSTPTPVPVVLTTTPPPATVAPVLAKTLAEAAGQVIEVPGERLTINSATTAKKLSIVDVADATHTYLVFDVTILNTGTEKLSYNPVGFTGKDLDGYEYDSDFTAVDKALQSGELAAGDKARGKVVFLLPTALKQLTVTYDTTPFSRHPGPVSFTFLFK